MTNETKINIGDKVTISISVWSEKEQTIVRNFYEGAITEVVERSVSCVYVKISELDKLIPIDSVSCF